MENCFYYNDTRRKARRQVSYTTVDKDFIIRVKSAERTGMVSTENFLELVGNWCLACSLIERVYNKGLDECSVKLRRGIEFTFVSR